MASEAGTGAGHENMQRTNHLLLGAAVSGVLGVLSLALYLHLLPGVPAIIIGLVSLRRINATDDYTSPTLRWGRRLAVGGMVLGTAGSLLGVVGLVSVKIMQITEASRREQCAYQLGVIGKAVNLYSNYHEAYPGATVETPPGPAVLAPWLAEPYARRLGWLVAVLPYLEGQARRRGNPGFPYEELAGTFDPRQPWRAPANAEGANTSIRTFLCPSHPDFDPAARPALSYYVGSTGVGADAVELPAGAPGAGFLGYERRLRTAEGLPNPLPRGQAYTLLATETMMDNGPWVAGDRSTLRGFDPTQRPYVGHDRPFGGMHPGGVNLLMVDGSVVFFTDRGEETLLETWAMLRIEE
jgi:prepilin-type processing-associated H-X9-DG protein